MIPMGNVFDLSTSKLAELRHIIEMRRHYAIYFNISVISFPQQDARKFDKDDLLVIQATP